MSKLHNTLGIGTLAQRLSSRVFGLELEMEGVYDFNLDEIPHCRNITEDPSLRNDGREFISAPCKFEEALEFFNAVMHSPNVTWQKGVERCTERGSIHVHVNCLFMEEEKIVDVLRLYSMLEAGFFDFIEPHRRNNIYCVPLSSTTLPHKLHHNTLNNVVGNWHKYTALNAMPLTNQGTLEFRHLQATDDVNVLSHWLKCIDNLFNAADRFETIDISFPQLIQCYEQVFDKQPTTETLETLALCHQEDVLYRHSFSPKTLMERIRTFKRKDKVCVD